MNAHTHTYTHIYIYAQDRTHIHIYISTTVYIYIYTRLCCCHRKVTMATSSPRRLVIKPRRSFFALSLSAPRSPAHTFTHIALYAQRYFPSLYSPPSFFDLNTEHRLCSSYIYIKYNFLRLCPSRGTYSIDTPMLYVVIVVLSSLHPRQPIRALCISLWHTHTHIHMFIYVHIANGGITLKFKKPIPNTRLAHLFIILQRQNFYLLFFLKIFASNTANLTCPITTSSSCHIVISLGSAKTFRLVLFRTIQDKFWLFGVLLARLFTKNLTTVIMDSVTKI